MYVRSTYCNSIMQPTRYLLVTNAPNDDPTLWESQDQANQVHVPHDQARRRSDVSKAGEAEAAKSLHVKAATGLGGTAGPGYGGGAIASQLVPHVLADASAV